MTQLLLLLVALPVVCYHWAAQNKPDLKWRLTGISYGLVIAPISLAMLRYTHVPLVGKLIGFIGLVLNLIHGSLGYFLVVGVGLQDPGIALTASELSAINITNGLIWGVYYGLTGHNLDVKWAAGAAVPQDYKTRRIVG
ncbi:MAG: hypothetical protein ACOY8P_08590 [Thermodesulfobacteriota bacterium]|jgi:hypothetical protein